MNNLPNIPKRIIIEIKLTTLALCNGPNYEINALEFDLNISFILWEMIYFFMVKCYACSYLFHNVSIEHFS